MDLEFTEEEDLLRKTAREFAKSELEPFMEQFPEAPLPREAVVDLLQMVRPFGMLGARIPKELGGEEMSHVQLGILCEAFGPEVSMDACTNDLVALRMYHGGREELYSKYIGPLVEGKLVGGSAISEPDAGSDLGSISTRADLVDGEYVVNGTKLWSSQASVADVLLAAVSLGKDARGRAKVARLVIDREQSTYQTRELDMLGLNRHNMAEISFEDCRVPAGNLVGAAGDGVAALTESWLSQRAHLGLMAVYLAADALDASLRYAKEREQFGRPIGGFQLVQEMLVDMSILVDTSRYLCYHALHLIDKGKGSRYASSVAKCYATESAVKVTSMAIQVHGAMGLNREFRLEKLFRDARMLTIPDGTSQIQKLIAGRELLGINAIRG